MSEPLSPVSAKRYARAVAYVQRSARGYGNVGGGVVGSGVVCEGGCGCVAGLDLEGRILRGPLEVASLQADHTRLLQDAG